MAEKSHDTMTLSQPLRKYAGMPEIEITAISNRMKGQSLLISSMV